MIMKLIDIHEEYMTNHIIDQLNDLGFYDTEGKTQRELKYILARKRITEIEPDVPGQGWF